MARGQPPHYECLLRRRRWPVAYLGQAVPLPDLAALVNKIHVPAVVLVAMVERTAENLIDWPKFFPDTKETGRPVVVFGGAVFSEHPEWREKVPGVFLGISMREGVEKLDSLLHTMFSTSE